MGVSYLEFWLSNFYFLYKLNFGKIGREDSYQFLPSELKLLSLKRKLISLEMSIMIITYLINVILILIYLIQNPTILFVLSHTLQARSHSVTTTQWTHLFEINKDCPCDFPTRMVKQKLRSLQKNHL